MIAKAIKARPLKYANNSVIFLCDRTSVGHVLKENVPGTIFSKSGPRTAAARS